MSNFPKLELSNRGCKAWLCGIACLVSIGFCGSLKAQAPGGQQFDAGVVSNYQNSGQRGLTVQPQTAPQQNFAPNNGGQTTSGPVYLNINGQPQNNATFPNRQRQPFPNANNYNRNSAPQQFIQRQNQPQQQPQRYIGYPQQRPQQIYPVQNQQPVQRVPYSPYTPMPFVRPIAQPRVLTGPSAPTEPLPQEIAAIPQVGAELKVVHHRSKLVRTKSRILKTAIADPSVIEVVQYSENEIGIIGLELGATTLTLWFEGNPNPLIYLIDTIRDPDAEDQRKMDFGKLEKKLQILFPNSKVYLIPLTRRIIVQGQAADSEEAQRILAIVRGEFIDRNGSLGNNNDNDFGGGGFGFGRNGANNRSDDDDVIINMLTVPGEFQITLHCRIAELNRSMLRRMGVDLDQIMFNSARHSISSIAGGAPGTLVGMFENGEVNVLVNWLAGNGTAKILSQPTLTVLSGHSASFLSGGEFAVPTVIGIDGAQGQGTSFRGFGTSLLVTPTIIDRDLIRLQIAPEFSQVNNANAVGGIPGVDSRRVQTTVELREGQTIALAGLYSHQARAETNRIPWLGELPLIGPTLFNAKDATQDETELLITVTPQIVRPVDEDEVPPVPGFEVTHPNDTELYRYGMTEGPPDQGVYQLPPYGRGNGYAENVGYSVFNPSPYSSTYSPVPSMNYQGAGGGSYAPAQPSYGGGGGGGLQVAPFTNPNAYGNPLPTPRAPVQTPQPAPPSGAPPGFGTNSGGNMSQPITPIPESSAGLRNGFGALRQVGSFSFGNRDRMNVRGQSQSRNIQLPPVQTQSWQNQRVTIQPPRQQTFPNARQIQPRNGRRY